MSEVGDSVPHLIARARTGDREAFAAIVRRYLPSVHEIVRQTSKGRGVPGHLVRETFHRAWGGLAGLLPRADFDTWLAGIARYVSREASRRRMPFAVAVSRTSQEDETRDRTFQRLGELPTEEREALLLRHLDGLGREAAAERLGVDTDSFDALARSGRERLRGVLPAGAETGA